MQIAASESIPYESVTNGFMLRSTGRPVEFSGKMENIRSSVRKVKNVLQYKDIY